MLGTTVGDEGIIVGGAVHPVSGQSSNTPVPMLLTPASFQMRQYKEVQPANAALPIVVTPLGSTTAASEVQPWKAAIPMVVTLVPSVSCDSAVHPANASLPTDGMALPIVTEAITLLL